VPARTVNDAHDEGNQLSTTLQDEHSGSGKTDYSTEYLACHYNTNLSLYLQVTYTCVHRHHIRVTIYKTGHHK